MNDRDQFKTDYHIHPNYSLDAAPSTIKDYCYQALQLQIREICFTTHTDLDPVRGELDNFVFLDGIRHPIRDLVWIDRYFKEISIAQAEFAASGLKIKAGIEISYLPEAENEIEKIISSYPFDYVLGGIHTLNHIDLSWDRECHLYFGTRSLAQIQQDYFSILRQAVQTGFFDCIAHLDIYKRYGIKQHGSDILIIHQGIVEPIFKEMAKRKIGLEINTSSLRRGMNDFLPSKEIVSLAAKNGIEIFTVGSDAHQLADLGDKIEEALKLLKELGLKNHVFNKRQASPV